MAQDDAKTNGKAVAPETSMQVLQMPDAARMVALEQWARAMVGTGLMMGFQAHEIRMMLDPFNLGTLVAQMTIQGQQPANAGGPVPTAGGGMPPANA